MLHTIYNGLEHWVSMGVWHDALALAALVRLHLDCVIILHMPLWHVRSRGRYARFAH